MRMGNSGWIGYDIFREYSGELSRRSSRRREGTSVIATDSDANEKNERRLNLIGSVI